MNEELLKALFAWSAANVMPDHDHEEGYWGYDYVKVNCGDYWAYRLSLVFAKVVKYLPIVAMLTASLIVRAKKSQPKPNCLNCWNG